MTAPTISRRRVLALTGATLTVGCSGRTDRQTAFAAPATGSVGDGRIGVVGDLMLGRGVDAARRDDPPARVWGSIHPHLESLDGVIGNLECCVSARGTERSDRTYTFRADPDWAIPALRAGNVAGVSLANNHVLDFGPEALDDTIDHLGGADIAAGGAGTDLASARTPTLVQIGDLDVGLLAWTDQAPGYAATPTGPGTAYLRLDHRDPHTRGVLQRAITTALDRDPDVVVASVHWGPNWVTRPAARYRAFARWLIDHGVDVVHGHSAHVIQGVEVYRGRPIIHDAGDFVDDYRVKPALANDRSFLFEVVVRAGRPVALRLRPVEIDDAAVHAADLEAAAWLRSRMRELSAPFGTGFDRRDDGLTLALGGDGPRQ